MSEWVSVTWRAGRERGGHLPQRQVALALAPAPAPALRATVAIAARAEERLDGVEARGCGGGGGGVLGGALG